LGRKYGVALCFILQRVDYLRRDVIDNYGTLFMMGDAPRDILREAFSSVDSRYLQIIPAREALVKVATKPAIVHVRFRDINEIERSGNSVIRGDTGSVQEELMRGYSPLPISYEDFVMKMVSGEITRSIIDVLIRGEET